MKFTLLKKGILSITLLVAVSQSAIAVEQEPVKVEVQDSVKGKLYIADEVVAVVGSSMILLSDVKMTEMFFEQSYIERGYTGESALGESFEALLTQKLLASYAAKDSLEINNSIVQEQTRQQLEQVIAARGSVKATEKFYNRPIFSVEDYIRERVSEGEMAKAMQSKVKEKIVMTPDDIMKFYRKIDRDSLPIVPEQYIYSQITRSAPQTEKAKLDIKEELLKIRERIIGGTSFPALARVYSEDPGSAMRGGEMAPQPASSFVAPFAEALTRLKPGQISEVIETEFGYHIIQLIDVEGDKYHCRHILMRIKFDPKDMNAASKLLDSIAHKVRVDSLLFVDAVKQFSDDKDTKESEGLVINTATEQYVGVRGKSSRFYKEDLGEDFNYINGLKENEVSNAFISRDKGGNDIIKIVKLEKIIPSHIANLKEDYSVLEGIALKYKQDEAYIKWLNQKIGEMYIKIEDRYKDIPIDKIWFK